jgi:hypothetical protein
MIYQKQSITTDTSSWAGVSVSYTKKHRSIYLSGHYDSCVGIQGEEVALSDFLRGLDITPADCKKAFAEIEAQKAATPAPSV